MLLYRLVIQVTLTVSTAKYLCKCKTDHSLVLEQHMVETPFWLHIVCVSYFLKAILQGL